MKVGLILVTVVFPLVIHAAEPSVKLAGIQSIFDDGADSFGGFKTFNMDVGHQVALIVDGGGKWIVGSDREKSSMKIGGAVAESRFFGGKMALSDDQKSMRVEYASREQGKLSADGTLAVVGLIPIVLAMGKEEVRSVVFDVEEGAMVKFPEDKVAGMPVMKVKSAGKPRFGDGGLEIGFSINRRIDDFAGVAFYDEEGRLVESRSSGSSWMGFGDKGSGEVTFIFNETPKKLMIAVENWTGLEELELKVDFAVGLVAAQ